MPGFMKKRMFYAENNMKSKIKSIKFTTCSAQPSIVS